MTVKRILLGMALLGGLTGSAPGQVYPSAPPAASMQAFPSGPRPLSVGGGTDPGTVGATPLSAGTGLTNSPRPLLGTNPYGNPGDAQPTGTLTATPSGTMNAVPGTNTTLGGPAYPPGSLPPGSVGSPWVGGMPAGANCCGPVGGNGGVTYEIFTRTGPTLIVGGSADLSGASRFGWMVEGGGRSLFMDTTNDAAWTASLSLMYAYNGAGDRLIDVYARQPRNAQTGQINGPDQIQPFGLRGITRTGLNYAVGRDWWLNGPGFLGFEQAWNSRFGLDVGGNYGTIRVDLLPVANTDSYFRRYSITHGVQVGAHWNAEVPFGAWIGFVGVRAQYGFHWSNVIPPLEGNFQDISLLFTAGIRF